MVWRCTITTTYHHPNKTLKSQLISSSRVNFPVDHLFFVRKLWPANLMPPTAARSNRCTLLSALCLWACWRAAWPRPPRPYRTSRWNVTWRSHEKRELAEHHHFLEGNSSIDLETAVLFPLFLCDCLSDAKQFSNMMKLHTTWSLVLLMNVFNLYVLLAESLNFAFKTC